MPDFEPKTSSPTGEQSKHVRKKSSGAFSIEELLPDDMGYDADIEIIRPDKYEDAESESDKASTPKRDWRNVDEELVARMRQLGREQSPPLKHHPDRGRKRSSVEMGVGYDEDVLLKVPQSPGLEIQELVDSASLPSPAKRRRRKSRYPSAVQHLREDAQAWTDSFERAEDTGKASNDISTSSTPSGQATPTQNDDDEMMDVT